jgi:hypothetical protein
MTRSPKTDGSKPVAAKPLAAKPAAAKPLTAKPLATKPAATNPAGPKPSRKPRLNAPDAPVSGAPMINPEQRRSLIAQAAYFRAEHRGFAPGHEAVDWIAAEIEVDTMLTGGGPDPAMQ